MQLSPWEATSCSDTQEFTNILWNRKFHYRVHKSPPLFPILTRINLVYTAPYCFPKIHFNATLPPTSRPFSGLRPSCFPSYAPSNHYLFTVCVLIPGNCLRATTIYNFVCSHPSVVRKGPQFTVCVLLTRKCLGGTTIFTLCVLLTRKCLGGTKIYTLRAFNQKMFGRDHKLHFMCS
jgi:hypothetical protein